MQKSELFKLKTLVGLCPFNDRDIIIEYRQNRKININFFVRKKKNVFYIANRLHLGI